MHTDEEPAAAAPAQERQPLLVAAQNGADERGSDQESHKLHAQASGQACSFHVQHHVHSRRQHSLRLAVGSALVGNVLEWYDFLTYAYLGSVLSRLFFPSESPHARLLALYGVFAAGFITRPAGAALFGRIGDV